jgi:hypothetical protein
VDVLVLVAHKHGKVAKRLAVELLLVRVYIFDKGVVGF